MSRALGRLDRLVAPEHRRDFLAFGADLLTFGVATSFISRSTVLPSLVRGLTDSAPLVGLVETICNGAWLLPQLLAARFLLTRSSRKPYVVRTVLVQRTLFLCLGPVLLLLAPRSPGTAAAILFVVLGVFYAMDAFASLAWFDLMSLAMPTETRGRLIGISQLASGLASVGCGYLVGRILASPRLEWAQGYALLFGLSGLTFLLGLAAILSLREHPTQAATVAPPIGVFLRELAGHLRDDRRFRRFVGIRLLVASSGLATPFYILFALEGLGLGGGSIGFFTVASVVGGIASSLVMARLSARRGTRAVVRLTAVLALMSPTLALLTLGLSRVAPSGVLMVLYAVVFVTLGALANGWFAGFTSYLLESAPPEHRTVYVGLANTLNGVVLVLPFVGGWLLKASSFGVLFAVTGAITSVGLAGSLAMRTARETQGS